MGSFDANPVTLTGGEGGQIGVCTRPFGKSNRSSAVRLFHPTRPTNSCHLQRLNHFTVTISIPSFWTGPRAVVRRHACQLSATPAAASLVRGAAGRHFIARQQRPNPSCQSPLLQAVSRKAAVAYFLHKPIRHVRHEVVAWTFPALHSDLAVFDHVQALKQRPVGQVRVVAH